MILDSHQVHMKYLMLWVYQFLFDTPQRPTIDLNKRHTNRIISQPKKSTECYKPLDLRKKGMEYFHNIFCYFMTKIYLFFYNLEVNTFHFAYIMIIF